MREQVMGVTSGVRVVEERLMLELVELILEFEVTRVIRVLEKRQVLGLVVLVLVVVVTPVVLVLVVRLYPSVAALVPVRVVLGGVPMFALHMHTVCYVLTRCCVTSCVRSDLF